MRDKRSRWMLFFSVCLCLVGLGSGLPPAFADKKKKFRWQKSRHATNTEMKKWAAQLGVKCNYCHVYEGDKIKPKVDTPKKEIAEYCLETFVTDLYTKRSKKRYEAVSCGTCHKGKAKFLPREEGKKGK